ncbi:DNA-binding CsgD family transcriptional regulator [Paraburkholderia caballeronis]|uniref:helix-turn-helix transcriptional regulator n=1 Tax=Paraburkholderia caballeronis TaxID=416943 RepID=UPI0010656D29|nr:helix-turn-helix transcriptional regulator [Paraburkholderia caballeronis]TDV32821.1 DNA-binding CsgD family transcriptional regulator [Paraburkholderia caballeronis]
MKNSPLPITRKSSEDDPALLAEIIGLYAGEPDLHELPPLIFSSVSRLAGADVVTYAEFHQATQDFRSLVSVDDAPERRAVAMAAFARHMHTHPFWQGTPDFFGAHAWRESDFFSDTEFPALPMAQDAFLPSGARRLMTIVIPHNDYVLTVTAVRIIGRPAFSDAERDRMEAFRSHLLRVYRQAQERTIARLTPVERLRYAFPDLTPRQLDVASWIARGKSNDEIAAILEVGIDTVKAHAKAISGKLGADSRVGTAVLAHTALPFARFPPLWKLGVGAWGTEEGQVVRVGEGAVEK